MLAKLAEDDVQLCSQPMVALEFITGERFTGVKLTIRALEQLMIDNTQA